MSKTIEYLSVRELYERASADAALLQGLIDNLDAALALKHWRLYDQCHDAVEVLINLHNTMGAAYVDDLKTRHGTAKFKNLRGRNDPIEWASACPWADCP